MILDIFFSDTHPIALGHTRLSILDLSSLGHQPMFSPCGEVAIVFNGEIYNYRQLREELRLVGYAFNSDTDTEVLLNLYLHCGDQLLHRLERDIYFCNLGWSLFEFVDGS